MIDRLEEDAIRVLHIDDEPDLADMVASFLEKENDRIDATSSRSVEEAWNYLSNSTFDCIVSDYDMPKKTGIDFLRELRQEYSDLPFILYTGKGSEEVASEAISAGATEYLQKGTGTDHYKLLANRIEQVVEGYRAQKHHKMNIKALESAQDGIAIFDQDGYHVSVNDSYADIHNANCEDLIGKHWSDLYADGKKGEQHVDEVVLPTVRKEGFWQGTTTGHRRDGTKFRKAIVVSLTPDDMMVCSVRDISDRNDSKKHLNRYRALIEVIEDPIYVLDENGVFTFVNESFKETFGYNCDEIIGENISNIKDEDEIEKGESNLSTVLSSDGPDSVFFETNIRAKNGEIIPCEDHITALPYEGDSFNGSVGILRDITEHKSRKEGLKRQNERLDEFATVVSHDLRNPLSVAKGNLELLRDEHNSEKIDNIDRSLNRMEELIEDLLKISRGDNENMDLQSVDLANIAEKCSQNVKGTDSATVQVKTERTIQADKSRIAQIYENLIRNSIEHNDQDVKITIGDIDDGFYVEDDGVGIDEEKKEEVLTPGYTTTQDGTGFGLSIVHQVTKAHGWNLQITESEDGGARFEITDVESLGRYSN